MLHEIISKKKNGSNNGSRGVMDYMLKEKDRATLRQGAAVLRGDIGTQAKLIDSLVGKFKQQYITGCFSFEEKPCQVSEAQKDELMDMAEEAILAGLESDRLSITWIEHTDKDRLELNYIVAQVDLKHGRLFQPYVHSHDKDRFNALCTIQNIKHGYTEPNDPAKAQSMKQAPKLPKEAKKLKEVLNAHIEKLVINRVVNNREDIKQAFKELGFEPSRQGEKYLSFTRPDGGHNLKFVSSTENGLYGIKFNPNAENSAVITKASADFRASARQRFAEAQKIYDKELKRKCIYHKKRHSKPKVNEPTARRGLNPALIRYEIFLGQFVGTVPNPYTDTLRRRKSENRYKDKRLSSDNERFNRLQRSRAMRIDNRARPAAISSNRNEKIPNGWYSNDYMDISSNTANSYISEFRQSKPNFNLRILTADKRGRFSESSGVSENEQTAIRSSTTGLSESARNDIIATKRNGPAGQTFKTEGSGYSRVDDLITKISTDSSKGAASVTGFIKKLDRLDRSASKRVQKFAADARVIHENAKYIGERVSSIDINADDVNSDYERLSERVATAQQMAMRIIETRAKIERATANTERNRQLKKSFDDCASSNRKADKNSERVIEWVKEQLAIKKQSRQEELSRSYSSPRP